MLLESPTFLRESRFHEWQDGRWFQVHFFELQKPQPDHDNSHIRRLNLVEDQTISDTRMGKLGKVTEIWWNSGIDSCQKACSSRETHSLQVHVCSISMKASAWSMGHPFGCPGVCPAADCFLNFRDMLRCSGLWPRQHWHSKRHQKDTWWMFGWWNWIWWDRWDMKGQ